MITKFKIYEDSDEFQPGIGEPEVGDYVACEDYAEYGYLNIEEENLIMRNFISNNVGKVVVYNSDDNYPYIVKYKIPKKLHINIRDFFNFDKRDMSRNEIKFWSKNKKDVEAYLAGKKYNL